MRQYWNTVETYGAKEDLFSNTRSAVSNFLDMTKAAAYLFQLGRKFQIFGTECTHIDKQQRILNLQNLLKPYNALKDGH